MKKARNIFRRNSVLRTAWNLACLRHPATNADGTITTKYGDHVIPRPVMEFSSFSPYPKVPLMNQLEFLFQPRIYELAKLIRTAPPGDYLTEDKSTGELFLNSDLQKNGRDAVTVVGHYDAKLEGLIMQKAYLCAAESTPYSKSSLDATVEVNHETNTIIITVSDKKQGKLLRPPKP